MSTCYYIGATDDQRLTREQLASIVKERNISCIDNEDGLRVGIDHADWVHLYFSDDELMEFERFGLNDPTWFIQLLEEYNFDVISEHDDDYPQEEEE